VAETVEATASGPGPLSPWRGRPKAQNGRSEAIFPPKTFFANRRIAVAHQRRYARWHRHDRSTREDWRQRALYDIISGTGNSGAITTTLTGTFNNLAPGTFNPCTASLATSPLGTFTNTYTLMLKSASGGTVYSDDTPQSLTLSVTGSVIVVPEPGALALAGLGIAAAAGFAARNHRRRR
jgi:hypothetical protein